MTSIKEKCTITYKAIRNYLANELGIDRAIVLGEVTRSTTIHVEKILSDETKFSEVLRNIINRHLRRQTDFYHGTLEDFIQRVVREEVQKRLDGKLEITVVLKT
jgi:hypothetical protein